MTKAELIKALEGVPDDAVVHTWTCTGEFEQAEVAEYDITHNIIAIL